MNDAAFYKLVRRHPPRRKICIASVVLVCCGIGLEIYNQATASLIRFLDDSMSTCTLLAMLLAFFGITSGLLFGRAPKLFGLMIALTLLNYCSLPVWSRLLPVDPQRWTYPSDNSSSFVP